MMTVHAGTRGVPVMRFAYKAAVSGNYALVGPNANGSMGWRTSTGGWGHLVERKLTPRLKQRPLERGGGGRMASSGRSGGSHPGAVYVFAREGTAGGEQKLTKRRIGRGQFGRSALSMGTVFS
jgi:hypothetical protein